MKTTKLKDMNLPTLEEALTHFKISCGFGGNREYILIGLIQALVKYGPDLTSSDLGEFIHNMGRPIPYAISMAEFLLRHIKNNSKNN